MSILYWDLCIYECSLCVDANIKYEKAVIAFQLMGKLNTFRMSILSVS